MKGKSCKGVFKLIRNLIVLGIPLYVIMAYTYLCPMNFMSVEYTMWQEEKDYVTGGEAVDTIILGDSRAKSSIMPNELGSDSVYNIAIGGCGPVEMYYALDNYLNNHPAPKRAFVIFAPYHFCDIDNFGQTQNSNYLTSPQLFEVYSNAAKYHETQRLGEHFFTDVLSFKLRLPNKYMDTIYNARINKRADQNWEKYNSVRADKGYTEFGSEDGNDSLNYETHHEYFDYSKLVVLYYDKLLKRAEDAGIEVIIEQAPINTASAKVITQEFLDGYTQMLTEMEAKYSNAIVIKDIPVYDNKYFGDNNHMNKSGAVVFTEKIKEKYF